MRFLGVKRLKQRSTILKSTISKPRSIDRLVQSANNESVHSALIRPSKILDANVSEEKIADPTPTSLDGTMNASLDIQMLSDLYPNVNRSSNSRRSVRFVEATKLDVKVEEDQLSPEQTDSADERDDVEDTPPTVRSDRNDFVRVAWKKIEGSILHNLAKAEVAAEVNGNIDDQVKIHLILSKLIAKTKSSDKWDERWDDSRVLDDTRDYYDDIESDNIFIAGTTKRIFSPILESLRKFAQLPVIEREQGYEIVDSFYSDLDVSTSLESESAPGGYKYYVESMKRRGDVKIVHEATQKAQLVDEEVGYEVFDSRANEIALCDIISKEPLIGGNKYYVKTSVREGDVRVIHQALPRARLKAESESGYEVIDGTFDDKSVRSIIEKEGSIGGPKYYVKSMKSVGVGTTSIVHGVVPQGNILPRAEEEGGYEVLDEYFVDRPVSDVIFNESEIGGTKFYIHSTLGAGPVNVFTEVMPRMPDFMETLQLKTKGYIIKATNCLGKTMDFFDHSLIWCLYTTAVTMDHQCTHNECDESIEVSTTDRSLYSI